MPPAPIRIKAKTSDAIELCGVTPVSSRDPGSGLKQAAGENKGARAEAIEKRPLREIATNDASDQGSIRAPVAEGDMPVIVCR
jgi:hypothetical protein